MDESIDSEKTTKGNEKILNIYESWAEHQPAYIMGNKQALRCLYIALSKALESGCKNEEEYEATDGEGYHVCVGMIPDTQILPSPYISEAFQTETQITPGGVFDNLK